MIKIREMKKEDIPAVCKITIQAFQIYANNLGLPEKVEGIKETPETVFMDMEKKRILVAENDGQIVGSIRYHFTDEYTAYITRFCVDPSFNVKGVGKLLMKKVEEEVIEKGGKFLSLHTALKVKKLVRYYNSLEFYLESLSSDRGYQRALLIKTLGIGKNQLPTVKIAD